MGSLLTEASDRKRTQEYDKPNLLPASMPAPCLDDTPLPAEGKTVNDGLGLLPASMPQPCWQRANSYYQSHHAPGQKIHMAFGSAFRANTILPRHTSRHLKRQRQIIISQQMSQSNHIHSFHPSQSVLHGMHAKTLPGWS
eukprot:scaffold69263_cov16-Tisochrysis_lutea.AAC.1